MPESTQYTFTHAEVVELLVKKLELKHGQWQLLVNFGFAANNIGPDENNLNPVGLVAIQSIGIQRAAVPNNLTVDAEKLT